MAPQSPPTVTTSVSHWLRIALGQEQGNLAGISGEGSSFQWREILLRRVHL